MSHLSLSGKSRLPLSACTFGSKSCPDLLWAAPLDSRPPLFSRHHDLLVAPFASVRGWPNAFRGPSGLGSWEDAQNHTRSKSERSSGKVANLQLLGCLPTLPDFPPPTLPCHQILGTRGLDSYSPHWASWKKRQVRPSPSQGRSLAYMVPAPRPRLTWQGSVTETMRPPWTNKLRFALEETGCFWPKMGKWQVYSLSQSQLEPKCISFFDISQSMSKWPSHFETFNQNHQICVFPCLQRHLRGGFAAPSRCVTDNATGPRRSTPCEKVRPLRRIGVSMARWLRS